MRKLYNQFKWPFDRAKNQELLETIHRYAQIFDFALTVEGSKMLSQTSWKVSEVLRASQRYTHFLTFFFAGQNQPSLFPGAGLRLNVIRDLLGFLLNT